MSRPRTHQRVPAGGLALALAALSGACGRAPGPEAQLAAARAAPPAEREALYAELLRRAPRTPGASRELGELLAAEGRPLEAEPLLRHAATLDPSDGRAHAALGRLLEFKGDFAGALASLEHAAALGALDPDAAAALARARRALGPGAR